MRIAHAAKSGISRATTPDLKARFGSIEASIHRVHYGRLDVFMRLITESYIEVMNRYFPHAPAGPSLVAMNLTPLLTGLRRRCNRLVGSLGIQTGSLVPLPRSAAEPDSSSRSNGTGVTLVGAGPGDAGLLTLNALRALVEAEVILYDRLVSPDVLALANRHALFIEVGKQGGGAQTPQHRIHVLMAEHARSGKRVVRLKGGDPFVFGRGGEELEFLRAHEIDYQVIPGITSAIACAAYAGIPLTHRDHAQGVRFATAHCRESVDSLDWRVLADEPQTLAVYMAISGLAQFQQRLIEHGRSPHTAFALIENGSRPEQRVIRGTLGELARLAAIHRVQSPALLILGSVAVLADKLHWFGQHPLTSPLITAHVRRAA